MNAKARESSLAFANCITETTAFMTYPAILFTVYAIASLVTFALYARDKSAARNGAWRTPERTLHLLALVGGWPGALLAQKVLHHKSRKLSFRIVFWITVSVNCATLIWLSTLQRQSLF